MAGTPSFNRFAPSALFFFEYHSSAVERTLYRILWNPAVKKPNLLFPFVQPSCAWWFKNIVRYPFLAKTLFFLNRCLLGEKTAWINDSIFFLVPLLKQSTRFAGKKIHFPPYLYLATPIFLNEGFISAKTRNMIFMIKTMGCTLAFIGSRLSRFFLEYSSFRRGKEHIRIPWNFCGKKPNLSVPLWQPSCALLVTKKIGVRFHFGELLFPQLDIISAKTQKHFYSI